MSLSLANPRARTHRALSLSFVLKYNFLQNVATLGVGAPYQVGASPNGKSWIRLCFLLSEPVKLPVFLHI